MKTVPGMDEDTLNRDLKRVLNRLERQYPDFIGGDVETHLWGPPLNTPFTSPVVKSLASASLEVSGEKARVGIEGRYGAYGCGSIMAAAGIETCIYGPGGHIHETNEMRRQLSGELPPDEHISIRELIEATRVMALATVDICG